MIRIVFFHLLMISIKSVQSGETEVLGVDNEKYFHSCSLDEGALMCDSNSTLRFLGQGLQRVTKIELRVSMEEIPGNYFEAFLDVLRSIRVTSRSPVRTIHLQAFEGCRGVTFLEISCPSHIEGSPLNLKKVFAPLVSLEELKMIGLNIHSLQDGLFDTLGSLRSLTIHSPSLLTISTNTFTNNNNLVSLGLSGMKSSSNIVNVLERWPSTSKMNLKSLFLTNSDLERFPKLSVNIGKDLSYLSLAKNPIVKIEAEDVANLTNLKGLSLVSTSLDKGSIPGLRLLKNLEELKLTDVGTLKDLPTEIETLESLESFDIDMSSLENISVSLPLSVRKISASNLPKSVKISSIFLSRTLNLEILYLIGLPMNSIEFLIEQNWVRNCSLKVLSLDNTNLLKGQLMDLLGSLQSLNVLHLNNANVDSIPDKVFLGLRSLNRLMLSGNRLQYASINTPGFQRISGQLDFLDLSGNLLASLPPCSFYSFSNFSALNLQGNPVVCDCKMLWLLEVVRTRNVSRRFDFRCASGPNSGRLFRQLAEEDLKNCSRLPMEACIPQRDPGYKIAYSTTYNPSSLTLTINGINGSDLKFIFDYFTLIVKCPNNTYHSDLRKYDLTRRFLDLKLSPTSKTFEVCVVLVRNLIDYIYEFNCQTVRPTSAGSDSSGSTLTGALVGCGGLLLIGVGLVIWCCRRRRKDKGGHDYYEASSAEYTEPHPQDKPPERYTYLSDQRYYTDSGEVFAQSPFQSRNTIPSPVETKKSSKFDMILSKSLDNLRNFSKIPLNDLQSKFRKKSPVKEMISRHISASSNLLDNDPQWPPHSSLQDLHGRRPFPLPLMYHGRALPQTPSEANLEGDLEDRPPPKPRLFNGIQNLLDSADHHLKYFSQYLSRTSLGSKGSQQPAESRLEQEPLRSRLANKLCESSSVII